MVALAKCDPLRWGAFLKIPDNAPLTDIGEHKDLFVGKDQSVIINLKSSTVTEVGDVVVLGELTILSSDPENRAGKPSLVARDFFVAGKFLMSNVKVCYRNFERFEGAKVFCENLWNLISEWLNFQKESAEKTGLKSVLSELWWRSDANVFPV